MKGGEEERKGTYEVDKDDAVFRNTVFHDHLNCLDS